MYNIIIAAISCLLIVLIFRKRYLIMMRNSVLGTHVATSVDTYTAGVTTADEEMVREPDPSASRGDLSLDFSEVNRTFRIADMHFSRGDLETAEKHFIKVLSIYEHHQEALNRLGVIYIQQKQEYKAELLYQKLLKLVTREPVYYSNYGRCLYNQKKHSAAIAAYEKALELDSKRAARFVSLGQIYYELGKYAKALEYFSEAHRLEPRNVEYLQLVADLYESFGDQKNVELFLKKIVNLDPYNKLATAKLEKLGQRGGDGETPQDENQPELL